MEKEIDKLNSSCFKLLGTIQNKEETPEWQMEFIKALNEIQVALNAFKK